MSRRTIGETFAALRATGDIGLMPFVPAGYPDLATTTAVIPALESAGASLIEIGIPFSDPIADGPTIQQAFTEALQKHVRVSQVFETIGAVRASVSISLVAMVSYSVAFRYGLDRFLRDARESGFDGMIFPDLPPPEAQEVCDKIRASGLDTVLLVAPSTPPQRRAEIVKLCSGFVYYLSVSGITGERDRLPPDLEANVRNLRDLTDRPICVGFGISRPEHVKQLHGIADGAIVGSAVVKRMQERARESPQAIAASTGALCAELLSQVR
jgi:tryptophan synthase alpha chain